MPACAGMTAEGARTRGVRRKQDSDERKEQAILETCLLALGMLD
jgi:hypothetical protein